MPVERPVTVFMNDVEVATMQATPDDLEELAAGFLVTEGLLTDREALRSVDADYKRGLVYVETAESVPDELTYRKRYITSGCGKGVTFSSVGHARDLAHVESDLRVDAVPAPPVDARDERGAPTSTATPAACRRARSRVGRAPVRARGRRPPQRGRQAARPGVARPHPDRTTRSCCHTGRISYEMAVKAAKARVPIVVRKQRRDRPGGRDRRGARHHAGRLCRGGGMVVYTHPERVAQRKED